MSEIRPIDANAFMLYLGLEDTEEMREANCGDIVTIEDFDRQPTLDYAPVVHGHWIIEVVDNVYVGKVNKMTCSECRDSFKASDGALPHEHYCRNCGAKMDEVIEDGNNR